LTTGNVANRELISSNPSNAVLRSDGLMATPTAYFWYNLFALSLFAHASVLKPMPD
jgi:hypothetical protein